MPRGRLSRALALCCALAALTAAQAAADGALVKVNDIVLRTDAGFQPRSLPRHQFVPIGFQGYFDIAARGGGKPVALETATIDFDRDGRLSPAGLPVCPPARVADAGAQEARRACGGAIVGKGRIEVLLDLGGGQVPVGSALTVFNGPPQAGHPTAVLHARFPAPVSQTLAIVAAIERRPGPFRYRATLAIPPIAGGLGAITRVEARLGRRFSVNGQRRSYLAAHCSDGILRTRGRFGFADGTIVDGSVEKPCTPR